MKIDGRRVHIAGSANVDTPSDRLAYAHAIVAELVGDLVRHGATFICQAGGEPRGSTGVPAQSVIFDWTMIEMIGAQLRAGVANASGDSGRLLAVVSTHKTEQQIPDERRELWDEVVTADAVRTEHIEGQWTSGALRRERQSQLGDVLIAVSGGEGVEHLARLYASQGKPVIPLDLDLGSSSGDGSGGASRLHQEALAHPEQFFRLADPSAGVTALAATSTRDLIVAAGDVAHAVLKLLTGLRDPEAFYVRLLDPTAAEFADVDEFFRDVVDPVILDLGYSRAQMGAVSVEEAFMNVEIFTRIHHAGLVVVDLTGTRGNCLMELGYAFGRTKRVMVTARDDTQLPFDPAAIDTYMWRAAEDATTKVRELKKYCGRTALRPPLVKPRGWQP